MPKKHKLKIKEEDNDLFQAKRDTKNIPRNITRVFQKYLDQFSQGLSEKIEEKVKDGGFNNTLITKIIQDEETCGYFKKFLRHEATNWLNSSRIRDKESHT